MHPRMYNLFLLSAFLPIFTFAQSVDSTQTITHFSGSAGITTNGFSIIPSFSLNSPAAIVNMSWRKNRFSFDPDIRLVPDASKGSVLLWLRYQIVQKEKFTLRAGIHPAFTLVRKTVLDNGILTDITEMLRFAAFQVVPNFQLNKKVSVGAMFLKGHGLQNHGPQNTNALFLNMGFSQIPIVEKIRFHLYPSVFFLNTDGYTGSYFTATGILTKQGIPFSLQSTINQTLQSNIPNNQLFMWNLTLNYNFNEQFRRITSF